jgi:gluconokinase
MIIILMGVAGSGKTTIAQALAAAHQWRWVDADDFHSTANQAKMSRGEPLTDADRYPWLQTLHDQIGQWLAAEQSTVLACSALKHQYREVLSNHPAVKFIYLKGSYDLIAQRLSRRQGHFANLNLLQSQFDTLEEPSPDEAIPIAIDQDVAAIVQAIQVALNL